MHISLHPERTASWHFWVLGFTENSQQEAVVKDVGDESQIWFVTTASTALLFTNGATIHKGDIYSRYLFGRNIIIIGSAKIAEELLDKRSVNYSDRPRSVMSGELSGWGKLMLLSNYNERFRQHRKWIAQEIGGYGTVQKFHQLMEYETRRFLLCVLNDPDRTQAHIRKYVLDSLQRNEY